MNKPAVNEDNIEKFKGNNKQAHAVIMLNKRRPEKKRKIYVFVEEVVKKPDSLELFF